jgi:alcohol dehydrogenase class IV
MADETIFTLDSSSIKFGVGATREVGDDMQALALQSLRAAGIDAVLYDRVRVEPTDAGCDPLCHRGQLRHRLRPLIAVPTTAGTGSETTGVAGAPDDLKHLFVGAMRYWE